MRPKQNNKTLIKILSIDRKHDLLPSNFICIKLEFHLRITC